MNPCTLHPAALLDGLGCCKRCRHNEADRLHRQRRVNGGQPARIPMTDEQRTRKHARDAARTALHKDRINAHNIERYHLRKFGDEVAAYIAAHPTEGATS